MSKSHGLRLIERVECLAGREALRPLMRYGSGCMSAAAHAGLRVRFDGCRRDVRDGFRNYDDRVPIPVDYS